MLMPGKPVSPPPSKKMDIAPNSSPTETIDLLVRKIEQNKSDKNAFTADVFLTFAGILTNVMSELSTLKNENMTLNARLVVVENCNAVLKKELEQEKQSNSTYAEKLLSAEHNVTLMGEKLTKKSNDDFFATEMEKADRTVKIDNFPLDKLSDKSNKADEVKKFLIEKDELIKHSLYNARIVALISKGTKVQELKEKGKTEIPILIECSNRDKKFDVLNKLKSSGDFILPYHMPSSIYKKTKAIREKIMKTSFKVNNKTYSYNENVTQFKLRPSSSYKSLNLGWRENESAEWETLTSISFPADNNNKLDNVNYGSIAWI